MGRFDGKVVIITGSSYGLGAATALAFGREGTKLTVHGRNQERLSKTAKDCIEAGAQEVIEVIAELGDMKDLERIISETVARYGRIDILVNNAGTYTVGEVCNLELEEYERVFNINLRAPVYLSKFALPHLKKTKGCIVNVTSVLARKVLPYIVAHSLTMCALDHFTRGFAVECSSVGVRVNSINPGIIADTADPTKIPDGIEKESFMKVYQRLCDAQKLGPIPLKEMAEGILFLCSSSHITGISLPEDGGFHVH